MTDLTFFNQLLIWPILNLLIALYKVFLLLKIPGALGWAVIAITTLIRIVLYPFTMSQLKSAGKLNQLKPAINKLSKKYKNDKLRLQQEQLRLYKEAGINPTLGCLPLLLQMPIIIALYNVFLQLLSNGNVPQVVSDINSVLYFPILKVETLDLSFFGANLGIKPSDWGTYGVWLFSIPVITALLQYFQTKLMTPIKQETENKKPKTNENKDKKEEEDLGSVMQKQMTVMMPVMIGFFSYSFPLGLSLYWNTFTVFGIIQQYHLNLIRKKDDQERKAKNKY